MGAERPFIASVIGTRPEAIKMAPLLRELAKRERFDQQVILTGQHAGLEERLGSLPIHNLAIDPANQSAGEIRERIHHTLYNHLLGRRADLVLVQGDTTSALAGTLAARDCGIAVGHVEAGLRSGDPRQPWPEEVNRITIDCLSALLFAPSKEAARNLEAEQLPGSIHVTGNTGIDALFHARDSLKAAPSVPVDARKTILVTCHRRESRGPVLEGIATALKQVARTLPVKVVLPLHTNPHVRRPVERLLSDEPNIFLVEPVGFDEMVALMRRCWLILTDSGGLQRKDPRSAGRCSFCAMSPNAARQSPPAMLSS